MIIKFCTTSLPTFPILPTILSIVFFLRSSCCVLQSKTCYRSVFGLTSAGSRRWSGSPVPVLPGEVDHRLLVTGHRLVSQPIPGPEIALAEYSQFTVVVTRFGHHRFRLVTPPKPGKSVVSPPPSVVSPPEPVSVRAHRIHNLFPGHSQSGDVVTRFCHHRLVVCFIATQKSVWSNLIDHTT